MIWPLVTEKQLLEVGSDTIAKSFQGPVTTPQIRIIVYVTVVMQINGLFLNESVLKYKMHYTS